MKQDKKVHSEPHSKNALPLRQELNSFEPWLYVQTLVHENPILQMKNITLGQ